MINNVKILLSHQMIAEIAKFLNPTCNIPYALVKGEALSIQAYNKPGLRQLGDIDILISRRNVKELEHLLIENGFLCLSSGRENRIFSIAESHQLSLYYKKIPLQKMFVDINFDIYWGEYTGKRIDIDLFLSDIIDMNIYGYCLKVLPPLKGFIYLLLHHYKDMNSIFHLVRHNTIRRDMFKDVFYYLKNNLKFIKLDKFIVICKEMKIEPNHMHTIFYTIHIIFIMNGGCTIPDNALRFLPPQKTSLYLYPSFYHSRYPAVLDIHTDYSIPQPHLRKGIFRHRAALSARTGIFP